MFSLRAPIAVFLACFVSSVASMGCLAEPLENEEEDIASTEQAWIALNGIDPSFFWSAGVQGSLVGLSHMPLVDAATGQLQGTDLLSTAQGQEILTKAVFCALPKGKSVTHGGTGFYAEGGLGLAGAWQKIPLDWVTGQRWVTACLLQFLNGVGVHVPINMLGNAVPENPGEDAEKFIHGDATMFGNLFDGSNDVFACHLDPFEASCGASSSLYLNLRICGSSSTCGITFLGRCSAGSCRLDEKGNAECQVGHDYYVEAVTTFLEETGFKALYRGCQL